MGTTGSSRLQNCRLSSEYLVDLMAGLFLEIIFTGSDCTYLISRSKQAYLGYRFGFFRQMKPFSDGWNFCQSNETAKLLWF